jgi:hypothetical protein
MKNYLVLYTPGLCGTWLTWLINQHKNFPQYKLKDKNYINDKEETKPLDVGCFGSDWYTYQHISKDSDYYTRNYSSDKDNEFTKEFLNYTFEENRRIRPMDERNNESFTKDCVKILPNHGCFRDNHLEKFETINQKLLKKITDDMQPEKIIVPIFNSENDTLIKRWRIWLGYHHKNSGEYSAFWDWNEWSDYLVQDNPYGNNVHYVDIEKLTSGDNDEYLKLCEAIDETPIDNIQEDITAYRNILSEVAEQYDRINK